MSLRHIASGKVREIYELNERELLICSTDRVSAFDVVMNELVPDRGRVLTAMTEFWLTEVVADLPHHMISTEVPPELAGLADGGLVEGRLVDGGLGNAANGGDLLGRCMLVRKAEMVPLEFVVRGYLAGSGWKEYRTQGTLHGYPMPKGLQIGSVLPEPLMTPSTKGVLGEHDINLTYEQASNRIGQEILDECAGLALDIYRRGASWAMDSGIVLADTKFELGYIDGRLSLCDEILTPDSSRYWPSDGWTPSSHHHPPSYDKQLLRVWLESKNWNKQPPPPFLTPDVIDLLRDRYIEIYERLTSRSFARWPGVNS